MINSSDVYFISDSHLSERLYQGLPKAKGDSGRALSSVAEYIAEHGALAVVFCGDNLDKKSPTPEDISHMQESVKILTDAGIRVLGIEGNHDKVSAKHVDESAAGWIDLVRGISRLTMDEWKIGDLVFRGMDYVQGSGVYEALENVPECDVLVMHQPLAHIAGMEANSISLEGLPDTVLKAVVSGHIHTPSIVKTTSGVQVVSPGATHARGVADPRGTFVKLNTSSMTFEFINTPKHRRMRKFLLAGDSDMDDLCDYLEENSSDIDDDKVIVGGKYAAGLVDDVSSLKEEFVDRAFFVLNPLPAVEDAEVEDAEEMADDELLRELMESMGLSEKPYVDELHALALAAVEGVSVKITECFKKLEDERNAIN